MCDIGQIIPGIKTDFKYAKEDNFTHTILYPSITTTYLRRPVALALREVQEELATQKLALKIWDAYRPYAVTKRMWDLIKDERYVADPSKGSGHNRGIAVDLTIISTQNGKELDMGTGFDNFSDSAHHSFRYLPENVLQNRSLLRALMIRNGFVPLETEWWHYYYKEGNFEVLDLTFDSLAALAKNQSKKSGKESNEILHNSRRSQRRPSRQ